MVLKKVGQEHGSRCYVSALLTEVQKSMQEPTRRLLTVEK